MSIVKALLLSTLFALAGSFAWGLVQWHTGLLAGPIAYGIGWGAAMGVLLGNGRRGGVGWSALATGVAVVGVLMAKVCVLLVAQLDGETFTDWMGTLLAQYGAFDLAWLALAIWPAWATVAGAPRY